jgi:hypothetical protein
MGWDWLSPHLRGGHSYKVFVTLRCETSYRFLIDCTVRPERPGNVANRQTFERRRHLASQRRGRSAEAGGPAAYAEAARDSPQHPNPSDIANRCNAFGVAGVACRTAREARECYWQLRRWLRNELQVRRRPLARMLRV